VALALITWAAWLDPAEGRPAILATLAQIAIAAGYYWLFLRRKGWTAVVPDHP
jgi:hypothetical protein